jgi:hypothetical protein
MGEKRVHQFNLTLGHQNQNRSIPENNQDEALQKFAELIVHYLKTDKQAIDNEEEHNPWKEK